MSETPENLVLVYLRRLDTKLDRLDDRVGRISELATSVTSIRRDQAHDAQAVAHMQIRFDRLRDDVERIKRRLDLVDA